MSPPPVPEPNGSTRFRTFAKYSGIAFQMLAIIGLNTWLGTWLDDHYQTANPWFTIALMLLGLLLALYQVIRSLTKES
ncbi:AtpZ/AtpI family protein [Hymenobacter humi]|uniref:AtpZ/AtpI family protein n=1 Tax=Hymenobacter humi TaxID=1411620 RepID=A0ABW2TZ27_9BACT